MPFVEGEWINLNPYEEYKSKVIRSLLEPGSGGLVWNSVYRQKLHDDAAVYLLQRDGLSVTRESIQRARTTVERLVAEEYQEYADHNTKNGFSEPIASLQSAYHCGISCYRQMGD